MPASTWSTTDKSASLTLTGSNLIATAGAANVNVRGKDPKRVGKYYIEYTSTTTQNNANIFGFGSARTPFGTLLNVASSIGPQATIGGIVAYDVFGIQINGLGSIGAITTSSLICCAIDLDKRLSWFRLGAAGNWNGNAANNPATGVGGSDLGPVGLGQGIDCYPFLLLAGSANSITANFGGSAFTGAVPAGFTSGWDDSVSIVTNVVATQLAAEHWLTTDPQAQVTQMVAEHWGTVQSGPIQLVVTQIGIEHWASVAAVTPPGGAQARVMVLA
jgi:hypothetical protein